MSEVRDVDAAPPTPVAGELIITITPAAHDVLTGLRNEEVDADLLGLRLEITSAEPPEFNYDLSFDTVTKAGLTDTIRNHDGLKVIISADDVPHLTGATLDHTGAGLVVRNPNRPQPRDFGSLQLDTDGELTMGIRDLLESEVNPSLAAHGGFVTLLGTDADLAAYLTMGGGCQGCSMSRLTMVQGVETAIKDAFPEVVRVVDVTDHTAGAAPYFG